MSDTEDNNGASGGAGGGAGENPEEEVEALIEGIDTLALKHPRVFLKLETTGFKPDIYITQIKAQCGEKAFDIFVRPPSAIESIAEDESGITYHGNQMYFRGEPVESVDIREALTQFLQFLRNIGNQPVMILGHNIKRYGCYRLLTAALACNMVQQLSAAIYGFVDTWELFDDHPQVPKTIEALYNHYFPQAERYDPSKGARALQDIVARADINVETFQQRFFSFASFECRFSWKPLEKKNVITASILKRVADREFHFDTVKQAFAEGGEERAKKVLQQPMQDGKPIVTDDQGILNQICRYLCDCPQQ